MKIVAQLLTVLLIVSTGCRTAPPLRPQIVLDIEHTDGQQSPTIRGRIILD